jgi:phosphoglycolate phosphatase-like HAD superfamily hydrolase
MKRVISFDIDGVLVDASERLRMCIKDDKVDWDCFLDCNKLPLDKPKPRIIEYLNFIRDRGFGVIIVTGRRESMRDCTIRQLRAFGISDIDGIFMRPDDNREPDPIYKAWMMRNLVRRLNVMAHFDDNPDTVHAILSIGIDAVLIS